jgi:hypothetical protein
MLRRAMPDAEAPPVIEFLNGAKATPSRRLARRCVESAAEGMNPLPEVSADAFGLTIDFHATGDEGGDRGGPSGLEAGPRCHLNRSAGPYADGRSADGINMRQEFRHRSHVLATATGMIRGHAFVLTTMAELLEEVA